MAIERVTERRDGLARDADSAGRRGARVGEVVFGMAILALVAIIAFFVLHQSRNDYLRVSAVTGAAATVAGGPSTPARNVEDAAGLAADRTTH
jgi:hypothetical protein